MTSPTIATPPTPVRESGQREHAKWDCDIRIDKFQINPYNGRKVLRESIHRHGNMLMFGGASAIWDRLTGAATVTAFGTGSYIGVGNSSASNVATFTDLQGASKARAAMVATFPAHTDGTVEASSNVIYQAEFGTGAGNFAWNEIGLFNASTAGRMLNRMVGDWGTKTSADTWVVTMVLGIG